MPMRSSYSGSWLSEYEPKKVSIFPSERFAPCLLVRSDRGHDSLDDPPDFVEA
jgi:hypothetical protein